MKSKVFCEFRRISFEKAVIPLEIPVSELPQMKIIILEPFILEGTATKNRKDQPHRYYIFKKELEEIAAVEKEIALEYGASFVELQKHFDAAAFKTQSACLLSDGVHPTLKGHEIIKKEWLKVFREL